MEEQYLLLATISHLFLAIQITSKLFAHNLDSKKKAEVATFVRDFKVDLQKNIESLNSLTTRLKSFPEL